MNKSNKRVLAQNEETPNPYEMVPVDNFKDYMIQKNKKLKIQFDQQATHKFG